MSIFDDLKTILNCKIYTDITKKSLYATDASAYRQMPEAVVLPETNNDIQKLIQFAYKNNLSLIPRGAGTSLAGQVVGKGIVVDISKHFTNILEINTNEHWVKIEPGVILSELNRELKNHNLFFGPETSTANRVTMGGMVGNNACGLHSIKYGSTRDHLLEVKGFLSDGSEVTFGEISEPDFLLKLKLNTLEGEIYRKFDQILSKKENIEHIFDNFPHKNLKRRNTGYALDFIADTEVFSKSENKLNLAKIIAGSEGTLFFISEIKLNLVKLPPKRKALVCVHFEKLEQSFEANLIALKYNPTAVELMDKTILDLTEGNKEQNKNRFFINGKPEAILIVEFVAHNEKTIIENAQAMEKEMQNAGFAYHFATIWDDETKKVWDLRRAGLGILSNIPGDARPVSLIEDTAVDVNVLPSYLKEFNLIMQKYKLSCVYHAHIGSGELGN